ncbi:Protein of unknown function [Gryllus bimaculatus]|nr:Protein of unknown function [Gryllus bimaculatus]
MEPEVPSRSTRSALRATTAGLQHAAREPEHSGTRRGNDFGLGTYPEAPGEADDDDEQGVDAQHRGDVEDDPASAALVFTKMLPGEQAASNDSFLRKEEQTIRYTEKTNGRLARGRRLDPGAAYDVFRSCCSHRVDTRPEPRAEKGLGNEGHPQESSNKKCCKCYKSGPTGAKKKDCSLLIALLQQVQLIIFLCVLQKSLFPILCLGSSAQKAPQEFITYVGPRLQQLSYYGEPNVTCPADHQSYLPLEVHGPPVAGVGESQSLRNSAGSHIGVIVKPGHMVMTRTPVLIMVTFRMCFAHSEGLIARADERRRAGCRVRDEPKGRAPTDRVSAAAGMAMNFPSELIQDNGYSFV